MLQDGRLISTKFIFFNGCDIMVTVEVWENHYNEQLEITSVELNNRVRCSLPNLLHFVDSISNEINSYHVDCRATSPVIHIRTVWGLVKIECTAKQVDKIMDVI